MEMSKQTRAATIKALARSLAELSAAFSDAASQAAACEDYREAVGGLMNAPETLSQMQAMATALLALNQARAI